MAYVKCPFCLNMHNIMATSDYQCPECNEHLPDEYVDTYQDMHPIWLAMVGFPQHGKTTYLAALTLMLENIPKVWEKAYPYYLGDKYTENTVKQMRQQVKERRPVEPTEVAEPSKNHKPLIVQMNNVPEHGSHTLIMYDVAGQDYLKADVHSVIPFIKHVSTVWFFVSPPDIDDDKERHTLTDLFASYIKAMRKLHISDLTGRNLLVIYTKADRYLSELPGDIAEYIETDDYSYLGQDNFRPDELSLSSLSDRVAKMKKISPLLLEYTKTRFPGDGERFINMVESRKMNLEFCITSALGTGGPDPNIGLIVSDEIPRYRVLDPFFWTLLLNEDDESKSYHLIVSNNTDTHLATSIWKKLSSYGMAKVYHLGNTQPLTQPEQIESNKASFLCPSLIGPILDDSDSNARIIVFTDGPIIDLTDFKNTSFINRLLIVSTNADEQFNWPHILIYRSEFDDNVIVNTLLSLQGGLNHEK